MKHISKILFIIFLTFCTFSPVSAGDNWKNISYFKRIDYKMRVKKYDPPVVLEWGKLVGEGELPDKLKPIAYSLPANCKDMDYDDWKTYFTADYIYALKMTREEFEEKRDLDKKKYLNGYRYKIILYEVDYLIDGEEYSYITYIYQETDKFPSDMETLIKQKGGVGTNVLMKENGVWKDHYIDNRLFYDGELEFSTLDLLSKDSILEFSPYDLLTTIMEKGFVYMSKEHRDTYPFEPCKTLKTDSYIPSWHRHSYLEGRPPSKK